MTAPEPVDWDAWRKCPVCHAVTGNPCYDRTGSVAFAVQRRTLPHSRRLPRTPRARRGR